MISVENRKKFYNFSNFLKQVFDETELSYGLDNFFLAHGVANLPDRDFSVLGNYVDLTVAADCGYAVFGLIKLPQQNTEQREVLSHFRHGDKVQISGMLRDWDFENKVIWLKILNLKKIG